MKKTVNVVEEEQVLFIGCDTEEAKGLDVDLRDRAVFDSAYSSTVCCRNGLNDYQSLDLEDRQRETQLNNISKKMKEMGDELKN